MLFVLRITASDNRFGIFKPFLSFFFWLLCCLVVKLRFLIAPLASSNFSCPGYCVFCPITASDSPFGIFKLTASDSPFWYLQTLLVLFVLVIVLSGLQITASDSPFGIFKLFLSFFLWLLCCMVFKLRFLIAPLASSIFLALFRLVIVLAGLQIKASDSPFDIFKLFLSFFFWLLCYLSFKLRLLIAPLASSNFSCPFSFGYCVIWPSNYGFW